VNDGNLLLLMLAVSWTSLVLQAAATTHLLRQHARYPAERLAGRGYTRTATCRVLAAAVYVTVAMLQADGIQVPGAGGLSPEALVVFTAVQGIWLVNSAMDIRVRRRLHHPEDAGARSSPRSSRPRT
jgi:hypothetical protein